MPPPPHTSQTEKTEYKSERTNAKKRDGWRESRKARAERRRSAKLACTSLFLFLSLRQPSFCALASTASGSCKKRRQNEAFFSLVTPVARCPAAVGTAAGCALAPAGLLQSNICLQGHGLNALLGPRGGARTLYFLFPGPSFHGWDGGGACKKDWAVSAGDRRT